MILTHLAFFSFFDGMGGSVTPPTPTPAIGGGGGAWYGPHSYKRKRLGRKVEEWVDEMYAEIVASKLPKEVKREAGAIVRPFVEQSKQKVPEPGKVDWAALSLEMDAVRAIVRIWEREFREEEEEEEMFFLTLH